VISDSNDRTLIACSRHSDGGIQAKNIEKKKRKRSLRRGDREIFHFHTTI